MPGNARFERCTFQNLHGWLCHVAEFVECRFLGRINNVKFFGRVWDPGTRRFERLKPPRTVNEFVGNDLSEAELIDVRFMYGIDLSQQELPVGGPHIRLDRLRERTAMARTVIRQEWRGKEQEEAMIMLDLLDGHGSDPWQQDLFCRRHEDLASLPVRDRVWDLLEHALD
jgi:hypothetical protein